MVKKRSGNGRERSSLGKIKTDKDNDELKCLISKLCDYSRNHIYIAKWVLRTKPNCFIYLSINLYDMYEHVTYMVPMDHWGVNRIEISIKNIK